jgi:hypothetical protein
MANFKYAENEMVMATAKILDVNISVMTLRGYDMEAQPRAPALAHRTILLVNTDGNHYYATYNASKRPPIHIYPSQKM